MKKEDSIELNMDILCSWKYHVECLICPEEQVALHDREQAHTGK
jgi:hypothetical protein